jgi:hypothetical protein
MGLDSGAKKLHHMVRLKEIYHDDEKQVARIIPRAGVRP